MVPTASICSISLGRGAAGHKLEYKLQMAAQQGFRGIELFYEDLIHVAESIQGGDTPENELAAAVMIRHMCEERGLSIVCLQPFMHYEGLVDRALHQQRIEEMHHWVRLSHNLDTDLILLPSSNLGPEHISEEVDVIVQDMREVAEIGLQARPVIRYAFEALCWGTRVDTWEASWDVVKRVNRSNFGMCLDSFNIAGRIYADPTMSSGCTKDCDEALVRSVATMVAQLDVSKLFLVQVADAERLSKPLTPQHEFYNPEQPPRMSWSRNARLFYGEDKHGAYLPVRVILGAIVTDMRYKGWLSFEVFNRAFFNPDPRVPALMAQRAARSWRKMVAELDLTTEQPLERGNWLNT
ncbi:3-dehydroshikimate dehydratase [Metarhizium album ARSEF 1941]|uniref:3-dehydroshikimate dehydratase n=1 Tax=Metarhizium album (strain ARSEF 1941) TaxID=1081103 RepID=A0A0B2WDX4_METAS|nr:3-dehydroshikimate dehydratase [Metarhizium album ARSEF 1941]KHN94076.1 3-dehydroshikimate dehydratase [Metarhizium album ARSEF 1941]